MPEGVDYGPQFTASLGKTLNYIGDHCYAASGAIAADSGNEAECLNFTTGPGYIVAKVEFTHTVLAGYEIGMLLYFNGELALKVASDGVPPFNSSHAYHIIIPPYTHFRGTWFSRDTNTANGFLFVTGKVYGRQE